MDKLDLTLHTLLKNASEKAPVPIPETVAGAIRQTLTALPDIPPHKKGNKIKKGL